MFELQKLCGKTLEGFVDGVRSLADAKSSISRKSSKHQSGITAHRLETAQFVHHNRDDCMSRTPTAKGLGQLFPVGHEPHNRAPHVSGLGAYPPDMRVKNGLVVKQICKQVAPDSKTIKRVQSAYRKSQKDGEQDGRTERPHCPRPRWSVWQTSLERLKGSKGLAGQEGSPGTVSFVVVGVFRIWHPNRENESVFRCSEESETQQVSKTKSPFDDAFHEGLEPWQYLQSPD